MVVRGGSSHGCGVRGFPVDGVGMFQDLALAFFLDAEHQGVLGRAHIQAHDIANLLDKERVLGKRKGLGAMGCQLTETRSLLKSTFAAIQWVLQ